MSKSLKNVINPDEEIARYGADSVRMYEMFMGPLTMSKPWNTQGIIGINRFLQKIWDLSEKPIEKIDLNGTKDKTLAALKKTFAATVKKVTKSLHIASGSVSCFDNSLMKIIIWLIAVLKSRFAA